MCHIAIAPNIQTGFVRSSCTRAKAKQKRKKKKQTQNAGNWRQKKMLLCLGSGQVWGKLWPGGQNLISFLIWPVELGETASSCEAGHQDVCCCSGSLSNYRTHCGPSTQEAWPLPGYLLLQSCINGIWEKKKSEFVQKLIFTIKKKKQIENIERV